MGKNEKASVDGQILGVSISKKSDQEVVQSNTIQETELTWSILHKIVGQITPSIGNVGGDAWQRIVDRGNALKELLRAPAKIEAVRAIAAKYGVNPSTLYRWLEKYREGGGRLSALLRSPRSDVAKSRLDPRVEALVEKAVSEYLNVQKKSVASVWDDLEIACFEAGLNPPHINTLHNRIKQISQYHKCASRLGAKVARERFGQLPSVFHGATAPHALVQVDHTKVDIILLDEETRESIGRPNITVVFDVYSRMVLGFYLSLDPPGALSVGLALVHAVLPKRPWLERLGLSLNWPCQGLLGCLYPDNALEFHGSMLERGCQEYGIDLQFRPLTRPEFGGHIERFMRTLGENVHALPGTTFSNVKQKGNYDSASYACMTLSELEAWMAHFIAGVYHNRPHKGIGNQTPLERYEAWFRDHGSALGVDSAPMPEDEIRFRLDFLPFENRTIQRSGVEMNFGHKYFDGILRPFVGMKNPNDQTKGQQFHFSYDPRDISIVYFWHPVMLEYVPIPWKDTSLRPISLWEARKRSGQVLTAEPSARQSVRTSRKAMKALQEGAKGETQGARRQAARAKDHQTKNIHRTLQEASMEGSPSSIKPTGLNREDPSLSNPWTPVEPFVDLE